jgi:general secretion pathway protein D
MRMSISTRRSDRTRGALLAAAVLAACLGFARPADAQPVPPQPVPPQPVTAPDATVTMNFVNADILAVIKAVADITGRNILIDPRVSGTVTIITPRPVPRSLVWGILLSALRAQGFTVVGEGGGLVRIVPESDAKFFGGGVGPGRGAGDRIVTEVFVLQHERAPQLVPALRPLISPNNVVNAAPSANALIVTDYAENVERIRQLIERVDRPAASGEIIAIPLKHASATDLIQTIQRLLPEALPTAGGQGAGPRVSVAVDARTNSVLVRADNPGLAQRIRSLAATLDTPSSQPGNIHVVYLRNADATRLAESLRGLVGAQGGTGAAAQAAGQFPGGAAPNQGIFGQGAQGGAVPGQQGGLPGGGLLAGAATTLATLPPISSATSASGVTIQAYPEQNSLVIVAPDAIYNMLRAVIDKLDARRAQIYVEALIVEVTSTKAAEFGIQWQDLGGLTRSTTSVIGATNFPSATSPGINAVAQSLPNLAQGLTLGVVRGTLTVAGKEIFNLQALVRALEVDSDANILSTPNLVTLDNEEARIIVGQNIPITTGSFTLTGSGSGVTNPFQTFARQDIGVGLRVRPQVAEGGAVKMSIYQEVSSIRDQTNPNGIILNKRALESQVVVDDGQILVLGGLIADDVNSSVQAVPFLGSIPGIGNLFRYSTRQRDKVNLMVFLRPFVIRDSATAGEITGNRYDYIREVQGGQRLPQRFMLPEMPTPQLPPRGTPGPVGDPVAAPLPRERLLAPREGAPAPREEPLPGPVEVPPP